jgi:hypothetical protein
MRAANRCKVALIMRLALAPFQALLAVLKLVVFLVASIGIPVVIALLACIRDVISQLAAPVSASAHITAQRESLRDADAVASANAASARTTRGSTAPAVAAAVQPDHTASAPSSTKFQLSVQLAAPSPSASRIVQCGLLADAWTAAFSKLMAMATAFLITNSDATGVVCEEMAALKYHLQKYHARGTTESYVMDLGATHLEACMAITAERVHRLKVPCSCSIMLHTCPRAQSALISYNLCLHIRSVLVMLGQRLILVDMQRSFSVEVTC